LCVITLTLGISLNPIDSYLENQILKAGLHGKYEFTSSFVTPSIDVDMDGVKSNYLILKNPEKQNQE